MKTCWRAVTQLLSNISNEHVPPNNVALGPPLFHCVYFWLYYGHGCTLWKEFTYASIQNFWTVQIHGVLFYDGNNFVHLVSAWKEYWKITNPPFTGLWLTQKKLLFRWIVHRKYQWICTNSITSFLYKPAQWWKLDLLC